MSTSPASCPEISALGAGDHLCCLYDTEEEHRALLTPYLRHGLERNEKVVYIVDARTAEAVLGYLREDGLDPRPYVDRGQLVILTVGDAYMREGAFIPDRMISYLRQETERAVAEGYAALRVTGEMSWALRRLPGSHHLIDYESKLNGFLAGSRCLALCQYDRRRFPPEILLRVLATHPIVVIGMETFVNDHYVPPESFLVHDFPTAILGHWIEDLRVRKLRREARGGAGRMDVETQTNYLASIVRSSEDAIIGKTTDGIITSWNPAAERIYGYTEEEMVGQPLSILIPPPLRDEAARILEKIGKGEATEHRETVRLRKDGKPIHVSLTVSPIADRSGNIVGASTIARDITERKRAEERLRHAQKLESLGVLAGGIAHDFNNLLMAILGHADLALSKLPAVSPIRAHLEEVERASQRAADLCRQMLAYSGKGRFVVESLDLGEVVREMADMLSMSISKKASLKYLLSPDLPRIEADASQIRQVVMNLIINASEAIGDAPGVITLATGAADCDRAYLRDVGGEDLPEGSYVYLEVSDTGTGMDRETQKRIFDPFFTTKFTGRGLGLAAVLGIVRGHRGAIRVYSEMEKGSTFKVLLPAAGKAASPGGGRSLPEEGWKGSGTVLLADDEEMVRQVGVGMLRSLGFQVLAAADGREALELFAAHRDEIACVVLDLTMPRMDGEETFREIRRRDAGVRVILTSGYEEHAVTRRFAGEGLSGFIQKPYNMKVLAATLREVIGG